jgi:hypothetical protein
MEVSKFIAARKLIERIEENGVEVRLKKIDHYGTYYPLYDRIDVNIHLDEKDLLSTLIHEFTHALTCTTDIIKVNRFENEVLAFTVESYYFKGVTPERAIPQVEHYVREYYPEYNNDENNLTLDKVWDVILKVEEILI